MVDLCVTQSATLMAHVRCQIVDGFNSSPTFSSSEDTFDLQDSADSKYTQCAESITREVQYVSARGVREMSSRGLPSSCHFPARSLQDDDMGPGVENRRQ